MMEKFEKKTARGKAALGIARAALAAAAASLVGACTMEPDYEVPETPLNAKADAMKDFKYAEGLWKTAAPSDDLPKGKWWEIFSDPALNAIMEACRANNPDLKSAFYTVERARQQARMTESELYPWANANASWTKTGTSKNETSYRGTYEDYRIGLGLTWDLDFFGRVQALLASDTAEAQALFAAYENTMLMIEAEAAAAYFSILQYNSEIELLGETVRTREAQMKIEEERLKANYSSELDLMRARQLYFEAQAQMAAVVGTRDSTSNYLAYLSGTIPARFAPSAARIPETLPKIPHVVPSELLERRPDIAAAERRVFAANYRIGAAKSAFFPTVQITSSLDLASGDVDTLINSGSLAWGVSPKIYMPIFQAGMLMAQYDMALAEHMRISEEYKAAVLNAIYETENALSSIKNLRKEYSAAEEAAKAAKMVEKLTREKLDRGAIDYFEYTDAQRLALTNERERIRLRADQFRAVISLVRAVGGSPEGRGQKPNLEGEGDGQS